MNCLALPYDYAMLATAAAICTASSFGVFRLRARMRHTRGMVRAAWLFLAALQGGSGVWATHYLAMLAIRPGFASGYEALGTLAGLLIAVAGIGTGLSIAWTGKDMMRIVAGSLITAFSIGATHYLGVANWHVQALTSWEPVLVWCSVVAATLATTAALFAAGGARRLSSQLTGAGLFSVAILGMHFIGMRGLSVSPDKAVVLSSSLLTSAPMTFIVVMLSVLMILGGLGAAYIDDMASRQALKRLQRLADAAREGLVVMGADGRVLDCNAAFADLYGAAPSEITGVRLIDGVLALNDGAELGVGGEHEAWLTAATGERVPVEVHSRELVDANDGLPASVLCLRDLRPQRAAEEHIRYLGEHDNLTGLPNRLVLMRRLNAGLQRITTSQENLFVLCVRVCNNREVHTVQGHAAGEALLVKIADRLNRLAANGAGQGAGVARIGGDEFAFFGFGQRDGDRTANREALLHTVSSVLHRPFVHEAHVIEPKVRIGVVMSPRDSGDALELVAHAESALQAPDTDRVDGVSYFRRELHEALNEQRELARELRAAIAADELTVYYQPQARAEDGALCGFEALVRWNHPQRGFLPPDRFISVAEENGLISALGEWVLRRACLDAVTWPVPVPVAVNLSPLQVSENDLPRRVHEILIESGLSPARLELEITESALFGDFQGALDTLRRLKALGVKIAMDDFGTGFSSLSTLQSFPFDKIKIDKSFVEGVGKLARSTVIVRAVLGIGRGLGIPVVAEGVETEEQMAFLRDEDCASIQGYLIGRPGPVSLHAHLFEHAHGAASALKIEAVAAA